MPTPIQGAGSLSWNDVVTNLKTKGALNKQYDKDVDGVLDWCVLRFPGVRQEVLQYFNNTKILIATSSMLELLNSAEKAGNNTSGISATSKELTIAGGTSTASGYTWIYISFPYSVTKVYACAYVNNVNCANANLEIFAGSDPSITPGSTGDTRYDTHLEPQASASDFKLYKHVNGTASIIASESVDLSNNVYYFVEIFVDNDNNILKVWRDNVLKFNLTPDTTNLPSFTAVRLFVNDSSTTTAQQGKFKGPVVVIYE